MVFTSGESAPHPAFGHPLPASSRGERGLNRVGSRERHGRLPSPPAREKVAEVGALGA
jgi:hypothetical protein